MLTQLLKLARALVRIGMLNAGDFRGGASAQSADSYEARGLRRRARSRHRGADPHSARAKNAKNG
jgi:hypothetical protein